jgi:LemA protein
MIIFLFIVIVIFLILVVQYNMLIRRKNSIDNFFASIDALLKKRYDMLPNLIETVRQYMKYEEKVQVEVTELRSKGTAPNLTTDQKVDIDNQFSKLMSGLMVSVENYPDLKANQQFMDLQGTWKDVEEQISVARREFNQVVMQYNNAVQMFPSNVVAYMMGFTVRKMFEIPEPERQNINAKELFNS